MEHPVRPVPENQQTLGDSLLEPAVALAALAFGFFTATENESFPRVVRGFVFVTGIVSLRISIMITVNLLNTGRVSWDLYRLFVLVLILLTLAYVFSFSPTLNAAIADWVESILRFNP